MIILFITGSRDCNSDMISYVHKLLRRVKHRGDITVLVGDAPGVDAAVIEQCDRLSIEVIVYGAFNRHRNTTKTGSNIPFDGSYMQRDFYMISQSDVTFAIWNGSSPGTKLNFNQTIKLNKTAYLWHDGKLFSK